MTLAFLTAMMCAQVNPSQIPDDITVKLNQRPMGTTDWVIIGTVGGLIAYDIWASQQPDENTITQQIRHRSRLIPGVPFLMGVLVGHLFFQF